MLHLSFLPTCFLLVRTTALLAVSTILCAPSLVQGQGSIGELFRRFEDQNGPVRKAKFFPQLGDAHFELARRQIRTGDYEQALSVLQAYVETVKRLHTALRAAVPDPEKKADGFKQLETHLRKSIRTLNDLVFGLPVDERDPFRVVARELEQIQSDLIDELFPRRRGTTK